MGFPRNGDTPSYHPFIDRIFHEINPPAIGDPSWKAKYIIYTYILRSGKRLHN